MSPWVIWVICQGCLRHAEHTLHAAVSFALLNIVLQLKFNNFSYDFPHVHNLQPCCKTVRQIVLIMDLRQNLTAAQEYWRPVLRYLVQCNHHVSPTSCCCSCQ